MIDNLGAKGEIDSVGGIDEQKRAQTEQQAFKDREHHQEQSQHPKRFAIGIDDHLIDHLLDQQRIHQAEELHEETGQQHLQQHHAMVHDRRNEPAEAKFLLRRQFVHLQCQHLTLLTPLLLKLRNAEFLITNRRNADDHRLDTRSIDHSQAIAPAHHQWRIQAVDRLGLHLQQLRGQTERFRHSTGQGQGGFAVALDMVGEDAPQQFAAKRQAQMLTHHPEGCDRRIERTGAPEPGIAAGAALPFRSVVHVIGLQLGQIGTERNRLDAALLAQLLLPAPEQQLLGGLALLSLGRIQESGQGGAIHPQHPHRLITGGKLRRWQHRAQG